MTLISFRFHLLFIKEMALMSFLMLNLVLFQMFKISQCLFLFSKIKQFFQQTQFRFLYQFNIQQSQLIVMHLIILPITLVLILIIK